MFSDKTNISRHFVGGTKFVISASIGVIYFYIIGGNTFRYAKAFQKCIFQTQVIIGLKTTTCDNKFEVKLWDTVFAT
jgi:hypothetical protein